MNRKSLTLGVSFIVLALSAPSFGGETDPKSGFLVIASVTVIDGNGGPLLERRTVVIRDGRILSINEASNAPSLEGAQVVNGSGRFLIPGLWNMHVHSVSYDNARKEFPALLAGGVTGVRDMGAPLEDVLRLRRETRDGTLLGPHMVVAGPLLEGPLPPQLARMALLRPVNRADEAGDTVRSLKESGVDFIKVDDSLPRESYFAIAAAARRMHVPFAGHVPPSISAVEASDAGQRSIEHLGGQHHGVLIACSSREAELQARVRALLKEAVDAAFRGQDPDNSGLFRARLTKFLLESYDEAKASSLFRRFVANDTWQAPTLVALRGLWDRRDLTEEDVWHGRRLMEHESRVVRSMQRAGVKILAGTDGPLGRARSGLYDELEMLAGAGLTPAQALQAATRAPAEFLGLLDSFGTIEAGKVADLVLLEANPLEDIRNVRRVEAVIVSGKLVSPTGSGSKQSQGTDPRRSMSAEGHPAPWRHPSIRLLCRKRHQEAVDEVRQGAVRLYRRHRVAGS